MYVITKTSAVWQDACTDAPIRGRSTQPEKRTLWARHAWRTPVGRCIGVRLVGEVIVQVCVHDGVERHWLAAAQVLSAKQARAWVAVGFGR